jgi:hypothetical protein
VFAAGVAAPHRERMFLLFLCRFESIVRHLLLVKKYRVEVFVLGAGAGAGRNNWVAERKGTPGNLLQFEDVLFDQVDVSGSSGV